MNPLDYIRGDRRGRTANRLERQALGDPLLAEALEGFEAIPGPHAEAIARLHTAVRDRAAAHSQRRSLARLRTVRRWTAVAAAVALMLTVGGLWRVVLLRQSMSESELVAEIVEEEMIEITREDIAPTPVQDQPEAPAPAPQPQQQQVQVVADIINVVSEDQRIESSLTFNDIMEDSELVFTPATPNLVEEPVVDEQAPVLEEVVVVGYGMTRQGAARTERADTAAAGEDAPFMTVSNPPKFQGGDLNDFRNWVQARLVYPTVAQENGIQGRVTLQFVVERDGRVSNIQVLGAPDRSLGEEALRVVATSPRWTPGDNRGEPARVIFTLPVVFQLQ